MASTIEHRPTRGDMRPAAEVCRERGWGPGTLLAGDEGYGVTVIRITGVGEEAVIARAVSHDGEPVERDESIWVLWCRDWVAVGDGAEFRGVT